MPTAVPERPNVVVIFTDDRVIDGEDARDVLVDPEGAESPHDHYSYHDEDGDLGAVRDTEGWKLHLDSGQLYRLHTDVEEEYDVANEHSDVVERLRLEAEAFEENLRENARPCGQISQNS